MTQRTILTIRPDHPSIAILKELIDGNYPGKSIDSIFVGYHDMAHWDSPGPILFHAEYPCPDTDGTGLFSLVMREEDNAIIVMQGYEGGSDLREDIVDVLTPQYLGNIPERLAFAISNPENYNRFPATDRHAAALTQLIADLEPAFEAPHLTAKADLEASLLNDAIAASSSAAVREILTRARDEITALAQPPIIPAQVADGPSERDFNVKVTQTFRVTKTAVFNVEAASIEDAIEAVQNGEVDLPSADESHGVWLTESTDLQNEECEAA